MPSVPAQNLQEFIALLKANPGKYHYGSSGLGAIMHLSGELFGFMAGTKVVHVPYRGEGPATVDLLAGRIDIRWWPAFPRCCRISAPANCAPCV